MVCKKLASCGRAILADKAIDRFEIDVPANLVLGPIDAVMVEFLGGIETEVIPIFVSAAIVFEIVELDFGRIFPKEFDIDFIVGVIGIKEEGRSGSRYVRRLHVGSEETVSESHRGTHLPGNIRIARIGFDA